MITTYKIRLMMNDIKGKSKIHESLRFPYSINLQDNSVIIIKDERDEKSLAQTFPEFFKEEVKNGSN